MTAVVIPFPARPLQVVARPTLWARLRALLTPPNPLVPKPRPRRPHAPILFSEYGPGPRR
ncbi:hypothetical protein ACM64Y_13215 [Novispirillum sp. DQ9]|uniref:hypothetical protein n=1 Tax=Novispirillum sp. DQ9 TaxID=3398612 RepID=UPI003C7A3426